MDPHKILGVDKDASTDEIKRAYRKKAAKYHPDSGGDAWVFQQIQDAYEELTGKNPKKRRRTGNTENAAEQPNGDRTETYGFETPGPQPNRQRTQSKPRHQKAKKRTKLRKSHGLFWAIGGGLAVLALVLIGFAIYVTTSFSNGDAGERLTSNTNPSPHHPVFTGGDSGIEKRSKQNSRLPNKAKVEFVPGSPGAQTENKNTEASNSSSMESSLVKKKADRPVETNLLPANNEKSAIGVEPNKPLDPDPKQSKIAHLKPEHAPTLATLGAATGLPANPRGPCLSADGQTLYFYVSGKGKEPTIYTSRRLGSKSLSFERPQKLFEGMHPVISQDGLELIFVGNAKGSQYHDRCFYSARRTSVDERFGRSRPIRELTDVSSTRQWSRNPFLSEDGLTLYFNEYPNVGSTRFAYATRPDADSQWSKPKPLPLNGDQELVALTCPYVTPDQLTLLCVSETKNIWIDRQNIFQFTRDDTSQPFANPKRLTIHGQPKLIGRYPRYTPNTCEFYFSQSTTENFGNMRMIVIKPFRISSNPETANDDNNFSLPHSAGRRDRNERSANSEW